MPSISLETTMIKKFLIEDSLLKWVDNKNKTFKIGLESGLFPDNSKDHTSPITKNKDNTKMKNTKKDNKKNKKKLKMKNPNNPTHKVPNKSRLKPNQHKLNLKNKVNIYLKMITTIKNLKDNANLTNQLKIKARKKSKDKIIKMFKQKRTFKRKSKVKTKKTMVESRLKRMKNQLKSKKQKNLNQ